MHHEHFRLLFQSLFLLNRSEPERAFGLLITVEWVLSEPDNCALLPCYFYTSGCSICLSGCSTLPVTCWLSERFKKMGLFFFVYGIHNFEDGTGEPRSMHPREDLSLSVADGRVQKWQMGKQRWKEKSSEMSIKTRATNWRTLICFINP